MQTLSPICYYECHSILLFSYRNINVIIANIITLPASSECLFGQHSPCLVHVSSELRKTSKDFMARPKQWLMFPKTKLNSPLRSAFLLIITFVNYATLLRSSGMFALEMKTKFLAHVFVLNPTV